MNELTIERSIWIGAPIERAWRAVTEPAHLDKWYATYYSWEIPRLEVGAIVTFQHKELEKRTDTQTATIAVVDAPRQFTLRWHASQEYPTVALVTSFFLTAENSGTRVTLAESGYEAVPADERQQWLEATGGGYTLSMENLKAHLEGRSLPH